MTLYIQTFPRKIHSLSYPLRVSKGPLFVVPEDDTVLCRVTHLSLKRTNVVSMSGSFGFIVVVLTHDLTPSCGDVRCSARDVRTSCALVRV